MSAERDADRVWSDSERTLLWAVKVRKRKPRPLRIFVSASDQGRWKHPITREQLEVSLGRAVSAGIVEPPPHGWAETKEFAESMAAVMGSKEYSEWVQHWESNALAGDDDYDDEMGPEYYAWLEEIEKRVPDPDARVSIDPEVYRRALLIARIRFVLAAPLWVVGVPLLLALYLVLTVVVVVGYGLYLFGAWVLRGFRPAEPLALNP
ncbi:MAG: hypothetical protein CVT64_10410 [Actinobacteria bacterium HGW-Actinobacteria-4]|nr:MAG: hypothetical protein CVT64_10410 [Actinobacteria bacterium HGW-Actinobacteria-4]